jgi:hypothetical protein
MLIRRKSVVSGTVRSRNIPVNPEDFLAWEKNLGSIEDLMPYLNDVDREFILSGMTPDEWKEAFVELVDE